jgi:hypothetical protein
VSLIFVSIAITPIQTVVIARYVASSSRPLAVDLPIHIRGERTMTTTNSITSIFCLS